MSLVTSLLSTIYYLTCITVIMHEDLTSYDCIIIIFTAILYSLIKVKKIINSKKETCFQLPLILLTIISLGDDDGNGDNDSRYDDDNHDDSYSSISFSIHPSG